MDADRIKSIREEAEKLKAQNDEIRREIQELREECNCIMGTVSNSEAQEKEIN